MAKAKKRKEALTSAGRAARAAKHELFCAEYIKDQNAARAARDAGYSEKTAREMGYALLTKPHIKKKVTQLLEEQKARVLLSADEILLGIKQLAVSDIRRLFDDQGCILPMKEWPDDVAVCVSSIEVEELFAGRGAKRMLIGYTKKLKLWDKPKSQENLGRNKSLFKDVVAADVTATVVTVDEAQVKAMREKIKGDC